MKNKFLYLFVFLILGLTLQSCKDIIENDINNACNSDCTNIEGTILTANNRPLQGVQLELSYKSSGNYGLGGGTTRKIRNVKTDENGYYNLNFYIKTKELGLQSDGYFILKVNVSSLRSEEYILSNAYQGLDYLGDIIYSIEKRDTLLNRSFYIPELAYLKLNMNNFIPIEKNDFFDVTVSFPGGSRRWKPRSENTSYPKIYVAKNDINTIYVRKRKNGVLHSPEEFEIFVSENYEIELTYEY